MHWKRAAPRKNAAPLRLNHDIPICRLRLLASLLQGACPSKCACATSFAHQTPEPKPCSIVTLPAACQAGIHVGLEYRAMQRYKGIAVGGLEAPA